MNTIEFYSDDILDIVDLGQISKTFDEKNGDYIKIELRNIKSDIVLYTFYSNRLLFEHEVGNYYFGDYHYNQTTRYFMEGLEHTDEPHGNLLPTRFSKFVEGTYDTYYTYEKQFNIYRDDDDRIYIKPNEVLGKIDLEENKYKLRLYFLRDIKSLISAYLQQPKVSEPQETITQPPVPELVPLYRFWNSKERKHYYTTDQKEYENLISNPNYKDWKFERIEGYVPKINVNNQGDT